jgi:hypothetical protein
LSDPPRTSKSEPEERVPLFGTWPVAYGAVIACALVTLLLLFLFSRWPF